MRGRYLVPFCALALAFGVPRPGAAAAGAPPATNAPPAAVATNLTHIARAEACLEHITELTAKLTALEESARATNQLTRADFIHSRVLKLAALHDLVTGLRDQFRQIQRGDIDPEAADTATAELELACARADQLSREAEQSPAEDMARPLRRRRIAANAGTTTAATAPPATESKRKPRRPAERDTNCLRQPDLALLLVQTIELNDEVNLTADKSVALLTKLAIEPLGGWQKDKCATLDDLGVAVARALGLRVENPTEPASYTQALRDFGLPVDTVLPVRPPQGPAPVLTAEQVREFFLLGLAAPPATARRLTPD